MVMKIEVYDLDGTVIDSSGRYRTIVGPDGIERIDLDFWRKNEHRAMEDKLLPLAEQYKESLADPSIFVVVATARVMNWPDLAFLSLVLGSPQYLISRRGVTDTRKGGDLKVSGLRKLMSLKQFQGKPLIVYEDNVSYLKTICDAFRCAGVYVPSVQGH